MSKARRIRKISVFTSGGKFPVLTLSYINTALSQSAFRIYKCYIIIYYILLYYIILYYIILYYIILYCIILYYIILYYIILYYIILYYIILYYIILYYIIFISYRPETRGIPQKITLRDEIFRGRSPRNISSRRVIFCGIPRVKGL